MKIIKIFTFVFVLAHWGCSNSDDGNNEFWGHHYCVASNVSYGTDPEQRLDVYSQGSWIGEPRYWQSDDVVHPTMIYFHGGGWLSGAKENTIPLLIPYLSKGWNVVNVEYRRGEHTAPQAVDDAMCALSWVAEHAERFNIDKKNVVLSGESAGGHLALIVGLLNAIPESHDCRAGDSIGVKAIVNWFGITDIDRVEDYLRTHRPEWNYAGMWQAAPEKLDSISALFSPVYRITPKAPAVITIHGQLDSVVPYSQAVALHELLDASGVRNELVADPQGKHFGFEEAQFQKIYTRIFAFLDETME